MNLKIASALFALAMPLVAQDPAADLATENLFLKAYYLEGMQKDFVGAMALYEQFLAKAPEHKFAKDAARQQYRLLDKTGKSKERDAFKAKYEKLLGDIQPTGPGGDGATGEGRGARGEGRGERGENRMDMQARMADLEKQIAKAKEAGDEAKVKELTAQLERMKQAGPGERPQRGQGGMMTQKKFAEMSADELATFKKDGLGRMETMLERGRERMGEETAKKLETHLTALKASLEANKLEDAQKEMDALREAMRASMGGARRGRGEGGGPGGGGPGGGGSQGGGGGGGGR